MDIETDGAVFKRRIEAQIKRWSHLDRRREGVTGARKAGLGPAEVIACDHRRDVDRDGLRYCEA